jgi:anti-sigma regulatory factor (Ser/Thr protein kinase)
MEAEFLLDNDPQLARALVAHLQEHLMRLGIDDRTRTRVGIALEEALLNGIYHGNLGVHSELKQQSGRAFERLADERRTLPPYCERRQHVRADLSGMAVHFVVRDEGPGFDVAALADPTDPANLDKPSGRGCC